MNRRLTFGVILALMLLVPVMILVSSMTGNADEPTPRENIDLENAIIVRELQMDSREPLKDEVPGEGGIIYDESFDDFLFSRDFKNNKNTPDIKKPRKETPVSVMESLKKKDGRWHITPYTIRKNDNLWVIARNFDTDHRLIIKVNGIRNPDRLKYGRVIDVPNRRGFYYTVKKGDTVSGLAQRFKISRSDITSQNDIRKGLIRRGERLFIPDALQPVPVREKSENVARKTQRPSPARNSLAFSWPLRGKITSGFGTRKDPFSGERKFHCGIDISVNEGTRIRAAADGRVIFSGWKEGYGNAVIVRHRNGYITVYAHNSKNMAEQDALVKKGEIIALSGQTGAVTGAHLHFEIRKYLTPLNPLRFL